MLSGGKIGGYWNVTIFLNEKRLYNGARHIKLISVTLVLPVGEPVRNESYFAAGYLRP